MSIRTELAPNLSILNHFTIFSLELLLLRMIRPEIGIEAFLDAAPQAPLSCIFKHLISDFIVQEVLTDETVCEIRETTAVSAVNEEAAATASEDVNELVPPSKLDEDTQRSIVAYRKSDGIAENINVDVKVRLSSRSYCLC